MGHPIRQQCCTCRWAGYQNVAGPDFEYGEGYVIRASTNNHMWVGAVSNYETQLNENLSLNVGFDFRHYQGEHYRMVVDFMGLSSWRENVRLYDQNDNYQAYGDYGQYKSVYITESVRARPGKLLLTKLLEIKDLLGITRKQSCTGVYLHSLSILKINCLHFSKVLFPTNLTRGLIIINMLIKRLSMVHHLNLQNTSSRHS